MERLAIFDLDGTLVDSLPDLHAALDRLMAARGLPGFTAADVRPMIGDGAAVLVARGLAAHGLPPDPAAVATFLADYTPRAAELSRPFPGIEAALDALASAGWGLAVCTNKPAAATAAMLAALGLDGRFAAVVGGDAVPAKKPDPGHVRAVLAAVGAGAARAVMIGDHSNDIRAATGANVACVFAGWGYGDPAMAAGAAAIVRHPGELPELFDTLIRT